MARRRAQLVYGDAERAFTGRRLLTNASNSRKWLSTVSTAVFGASSCLPPMVDRGGKLVCQQKRRPPCFRRTLMLSNSEIIFSSLKLVILLRYCVLLPSGLA